MVNSLTKYEPRRGLLCGLLLVLATVAAICLGTVCPQQAVAEVYDDDIVGTIEREGGEAVVPDLNGFLQYCLFNTIVKHKQLSGRWRSALIGRIGIAFTEKLRAPFRKDLRKNGFL